MDDYGNVASPEQMPDGYFDTEPFEDGASLTSDQWFGTPPELSAEESLQERVYESADDAALAETPSGHDYRAENASVLDVLAAREMEAADEAAQQAQDERLTSELEGEFAQLDAQEQQELYEQQRAALDTDHHGRVAEWFHTQPPHVQQQAVAWAQQQLAEHDAQVQGLHAQHQAMQHANQPLREQLEELNARLDGQQADDIEAGIVSDFLDAGVPEDRIDHAREMAEAALDSLVERGFEPSPELAQYVLDGTAQWVAQFDGRVEWSEDRGGNIRPRALKFSERDFNERGGYLRLGEGRPSVTSMFFGGGS
jgi:hypothetical protein